MISLVRPPRSLDRDLDRPEFLGVLPPTANAQDRGALQVDAIEVGNLLRHECRRIERKQKNRAPHDHTLRHGGQPRQADHRFRTRVARRNVTAYPERIDRTSFQVTRLSPLPGRDEANPEVAFAFFHAILPSRLRCHRPSLDQSPGA